MKAHIGIKRMGGDGFFDDIVAATYDDVHRGTGDLDEMIQQLDALATDRTALEFAIGTGRVALPLKARGVDVHGIELSAAMIRRLHQKDPAVPVTRGDITSTRVSARFSLVFLVYNTIDNLLTQDAQTACFANAAHHLVPGGRFVVETQVPQIGRLPLGETRLVQSVSKTHWCVDEIDPVTQHYTSHHVRFEGTIAHRESIPFRYAWPSEMDLMARLAGLTLISRHADWTGTPFDRHSVKHVSVWQKPPLSLDHKYPGV